VAQFRAAVIVRAAEAFMTTTERREREREGGRGQLSFRLDPRLRASLERAAAAEDRTISGQVRHIVARALEAQREPARS
jgi:hypothetical protein